MGSPLRRAAGIIVSSGSSAWVDGEGKNEDGGGAGRLCVSGDDFCESSFITRKARIGPFQVIYLDVMGPIDRRGDGESEPLPDEFPAGRVRGGSDVPGSLLLVPVLHLLPCSVIVSVVIRRGLPGAVGAVPPSPVGPQYLSDRM